jgi:hypothetical protein
MKHGTNICVFPSVGKTTATTQALNLFDWDFGTVRKMCGVQALNWHDDPRTLYATRIYRSGIKNSLHFMNVLTNDIVASTSKSMKLRPSIVVVPGYSKEVYYKRMLQRGSAGEWYVANFVKRWDQYLIEWRERATALSIPVYTIGEDEWLIDVLDKWGLVERVDQAQGGNHA